MNLESWLSLVVASVEIGGVRWEDVERISHAYECLVSRENWSFHRHQERVVRLAHPNVVITVTFTL